MQNPETTENEGSRGTHSGKNAEPLTRDQVLRLSSQTIMQLHKRVSGVRFKEQSSDGAKLAHVRALVQVLQVYGGLLKDNEITELEKRITELERQKEYKSKS
jgi:hypothetical protein